MKRLVFTILLCFSIVRLCAQINVAGSISRDNRPTIRFVDGTGSAPPPGSDVILVLKGGQSNSPGRAAADAPNEVTVPPQVKEYRPDLDDIENLSDPTGQPSGGGSYTAATDRSMNPNLGKRLYELTGKSVYILEAGKGNTGIDLWLDKTSTEFTNMLAWWRELEAYCVTNGLNVEKYAVWTQGENDAGFYETDGYVEKLNEMVNLFIDSFNISQVFVSRIGYDPNFTVSTNSEKIMDAQNRLNLSNSRMVLSSRAASTFTTGNGKMKADLVHYTVTGLNEIGEDYAIAIDTFRGVNKKVYQTSEPVTNLQPAVGYFDDVYLLSSTVGGISEIYGRNNLTNNSGGGITIGTTGATSDGTPNELTPATARDLTNAFDWSVEITFKCTGSDFTATLLNGRSGSWDSDWLKITSSNSLEIKGDGVTKNIGTLPGVDFGNLGNLALIYTMFNNTLRVYWNQGLVATVTDWAFTSFKIDAFIRSSGSSPDATNAFTGVIEQIRVTKHSMLLWELYRSRNLPAPVIDLDFQFNASAAEANNDISTTPYTFAGASTTNSFDADGKTFNENEYLRLGSRRTMRQCVVEFRAKIASDAAGVEFVTGNNPTPTTGGFNGGIGIEGNIFYFGTQTSSTFWDITSLGLTYTNLNTYKIIYNGNASTTTVGGISVNANTAKLYVNGSFVSDKSISGVFGINMIGAKHPTNNYCFKGTIDWFKLTNY